MAYSSVKQFFVFFVFFLFWEKVYFRSQILERPIIGEYWSIFGVPVLPENMIFRFFRTCCYYSEGYNTGTQKWSSIGQYLCSSIWDLKHTFSVFVFTNDYKFEILLTISYWSLFLSVNWKKCMLEKKSISCISSHAKKN